MSAYMVSNDALSMLTDLIMRYSESGYNAFGFEIPKELLSAVTHGGVLNRNTVFVKLASLNIDALKTRYHSRYESMIGDVHYVDDCDIYEPRIINIHDHVAAWHYQFLKSLQCYIYQCMEGKCVETELFKALKKLEHNLAIFIATGTKDYAQSQWDYHRKGEKSE